MPQTSIVIITWNSGDVLAMCVDSIRANVPAGEYEIIVVDNASTNTSYLETYRNAPDVRLILSDENLGYARAANLGLKSAKGEFFLILNPDIVFQNDPFPQLIKALTEKPSLGAVGPLLRDSEGKPQIAGYYRKLPSPIHFLLSDSLFSKLTWVRALSQRYSHERIRESGTQRIDQIPGAFLFFRKDLFASGHWMNDAYFLWMEDVDFCYRVRQAGRYVAVMADVIVTHLGGSSFRQRENSWKRRVFTNSYLTYVNLNVQGPVRVCMLGALAFDSATRIFWHTLRAILGSREVKALVSAEIQILKEIFSGFLRLKRLPPQES